MRKIDDIPEVGLLNGIAVFPESLNTSVRINEKGESNNNIIGKSRRKVFLSDSAFRIIWTLDVDSGEYFPAVENGPKLSISVNANIPTGLNGLVLQNGYSYYGNTAQALFALIPVDDAMSMRLGESEVLLRGHAVDDFTLGEGNKEGMAYLTMNTMNEVVELELETGHAEVIVGVIGNLEVSGATAAARAR